MSKRRKKNNMENNYNIKMDTPDGKKLLDDCEILNVVTSTGAMGIMAKHLPLVAVLEISHLEYKKGKEVFHYSIGGGILNVQKDETIILVESFEKPSEIDLNRALASKERAEKRISSNDPNIDLKRAEVALKRAINRISLVK